MALARLVDGGLLRRLARGVYDYPKTHPRFGLRAPSADAVAQAIARNTGESICHSGARAANLLGVSTQVPAQAVYLTSGTNRTIHVDLGDGRGFDVRFKRSTWRPGDDGKAGMVLQALRFLGQDAINDQVLRSLRSILDDRDLRQFRQLRWEAPGWMQPTLDDLVDVDLASGQQAA
jgi:hypothetical protein